MTELYITDSTELYEQSTEPDRLLYINGFIGRCTFLSAKQIEDFNSSLLGTEDEASRLMLEKWDEDVKTIREKGWRYSSNKFIDKLPIIKKIHSSLFISYRHFVLKRFFFQVVLERFFSYFSLSPIPIKLVLSEDYFLTRDIPYTIKSTLYYPVFKNVYIKLLVKQLYYFFNRLFLKGPKLKKTQLAIFLFDIHNEFDVFKRFMEIVQKENKLDITMVVVDSGNPQDKKVDTSMYESANIKVVHLYQQKANLLSDYNQLYDVCKKLNPLYKVFKKARLCEMEDVQYGFVDNVMSQLSPDVCMYLNSQELGRVVSNVAAYHNIKSICVEYAFSFDTYHIEKRIGFDVRACMSEVTSQNWRKHNDPSSLHEIIGFCKLDDWTEKLALKKVSQPGNFFGNNKKTIFFASTWSPNDDSPLLTEKIQIVKELSEICIRNDWNLIVKKHPSEFDNKLDDIFTKKSYDNQRIFNHADMSLFDCVYNADFVCTQNSTVFIESLYMNKPFSYISTNGENTWARLSPFSKEKVVRALGSVSEYEQYILDHLSDTAYNDLQHEFITLQTKYLYKTDGKASERLLNLVKSFIPQK